MRSKSIFIALLVSFLTALLLLLILSSFKTLATKEMVIGVALTFVAVYIIVWMVNEFTIFREFDLVRSKLKEDSSAAENSNQPELTGNLANDMIAVLEEKNKSIDELKKLAAFRKEFIADVSHELKTPIFAAQGFVHTLLDGAVKDKSVRNKFLKKAARSLDGLDALVQDLVTLSQMEIGELRMHREFFDIIELSKEVIDQFENKAEKKSVQLELTAGSDSEVLVFADPNRIFQVLSNLVSNAINYTDEGGKVTIDIQTSKNEAVKIRIIDSGIGIPKDELGKIFTRFYRVDKSRSRKQGGTGLGLAIVKHIVELHKSTIKVESELGKGSTFSFNLPQEKPQKKKSV